MKKKVVMLLSDSWLIGVLCYELLITLSWPMNFHSHTHIHLLDITMSSNWQRRLDSLQLICQTPTRSDVVNTVQIMKWKANMLSQTFLSLFVRYLLTTFAKLLYGRLEWKGFDILVVVFWAHSM